MTLIERLERSPLPNQKLDEEIFELVHGRKPHKSTFEQYEPSEKVPNFTGSIDAAMTLTPEIEKPHFPWFAVKSNNPNNPIGCRCEMWLDNVRNFRGRGATMAIAVCIAALRARGVK